jgi:hypothetical protein
MDGDLEHPAQGFAVFPNEVFKSVRALARRLGVELFIPEPMGIETEMVWLRLVCNSEEELSRQTMKDSPSRESQ